jgi:hypothetical protein
MQFFIVGAQLCYLATVSPQASQSISKAFCSTVRTPTLLRGNVYKIRAFLYCLAVEFSLFKRANYFYREFSAGDLQLITIVGQQQGQR